MVIGLQKLPTNVGTRIRKCVYESLNRSPPEWARKILEHSISKEVYKSNVSGPTKKVVLSVLAEASGGTLQPRPAKRPKQIQQSRPISESDAIMRKCRIVLRRAMFADEGKVFCNLLGTILDKTIDTEDASVICPPVMVSRPLDFRMIDLRLPHGAYAGSHEAFIEDVREVWHTIRMAYGEKPNLMLLVGILSEKFESLYEEEVLNPFQKFVNHGSTEPKDPDAQKEFHNFLLNSNEIPKAPWEDGVCKVCGIDKDDDSVLLCDTCDSEYHTYCLDPPLARIPEGNWYYPSCVASHYEKQDTGPHTQTIRRGLGVETQAFRDSLIQLATKMEDGEYWDFSTEERIFLLKVLCDEVLNSVLIRDHLEQYSDKSNDLQQKLRIVSIEWKNLQVKADLLASRATKESAGKYGESSGSLRELTGIMYANQKDFQGNGQNDVRKNLERLFSFAAEKHGNSDNVPTHSLNGVLDTKNGKSSVQTEEREELVWASALSCLFFFVCDRGRILRNRIESLDIRVVKSLLEISRQYFWAEIVHNKLICMLANMFYQASNGPAKANLDVPAFYVEQVDLVGGISFICLKINEVCLATGVRPMKKNNTGQIEAESKTMDTSREDSKIPNEEQRWKK